MQIASDISALDLSPYDNNLLKVVLEKESRWVDNGLFRNVEKMEAILNKEPLNKPASFSYKFNKTKKVFAKEKFLLSTEDEKVLFLQYNYCRYRVALLKNKLEDNLENVKEIISWYKKSIKYRDILVYANLALVEHLSTKSKFRNKLALTREELFSHGYVILLDCINAFDISTNNKFSTYATWSINREFGKKAEKESDLGEKFCTFTKLSVKSEEEEEVNFNKSLEQIEDRKEENDSLVALREIIDSNKANLTDQEKLIISKRYPRDCSVEFSRPTFESLSKELNMCKIKISKIEKTALDKLTHAFKRR
jgi:RNA polymerase sigma factor (sigma-70 family)